MKVKNCEECNKEFEYEPPKGFPDKRKYCRACSEKKKQEWDERDGKVDAPMETPGYPKMIEASTDTSTTSYSAKTNGTKEFHLSPEEVKCRALECAIKMCENEGITHANMNIAKDMAKGLADEFVEWIYGISE